MKKLSLLIALALVVTISGVYAAWSYAQGTTASVEITREINMAQVNTDSNKGSISATPSDVAFLVDDGGNYHTVLKGTGKFDITFTPSTGADAETIANGIKMIATITVRSASNLTYSYNSQNVVPITAKTENKANVIDLTPSGPAKTATLTVAQILGAVELCDVVLATKAENDAFHTVLNDYTIVITISEVVA